MKVTLVPELFLTCVSFLFLQNIFVHILDLSDSKGVHSFAAKFCSTNEALHGLVGLRHTLAGGWVGCLALVAHWFSNSDDE